MSTINDFLKIVVKYGWLHVQSLTYKNLTNKFPGDMKGCPSSISPFPESLLFLLFALLPSCVCPPQGQSLFSTAMETACVKLGSSVVSKVEEEAAYDRHSGAGPQRLLLGGTR